MFKVFPVQAVRIGEDRRSFFKEDAMLLSIPDGLPRVPGEHITVYTLIGSASSSASESASIGRRFTPLTENGQVAQTRLFWHVCALLT